MAVSDEDSCGIFSDIKSGIGDAGLWVALTYPVMWSHFLLGLHGAIPDSTRMKIGLVKIIL